MFAPFDNINILPEPVAALLAPLAPQEARQQANLDLLCSTIAESTQSLAGIVKRLQEQKPDFPSIATIYRLLRDNEAFAAQYTRAKEDQTDILVDEMLDIADDDSGDTEGMVSAQRAKLRIETRKWISSKLKPKIYGERGDRIAVAIQVNNGDVSPVDLSRYQ